MAQRIRATSTAAADPAEWRARMMRMAQDGDADAYRGLLDELSTILRRYFAKSVRAGDEIEDLVQETLLSLHRGRHTYDPGRPLEPWLFAIARNTKTDFLRRTLARQSWEVMLDEQPLSIAEDEVPTSLLADALESLPESQKRAFRHLKLEGRSVREAAEIEGTSEGNLRVRAHRAYQSLKAILSKS
jgi:RNA polymerase sigma-70 factor (ECF subfamily)